MNLFWIGFWLGSAFGAVFLFGLEVFTKWYHGRETR